MIELPDHTYALHIPVCDVQYCLMIFHLTMIEGLTDANSSLSWPLDQRLRTTLRRDKLFATFHAGQGSCIIFNVTKIQMFKVFFLHTAGTYQMYENLHHANLNFMLYSICHVCRYRTYRSKCPGDTHILHHTL